MSMYDKFSLFLRQHLCYRIDSWTYLSHRPSSLMSEGPPQIHWTLTKVRAEGNGSRFGQIEFNQKFGIYRTLWSSETIFILLVKKLHQRQQQQQQQQQQRQQQQRLERREK